MKKFLFIFFTLILSFLLISCENTSPNNETTTSNEWTPEGIWLGNPIHDYDPHPEDIDIELSFRDGKVDPTEDSTKITIVNKKGKPFDYCPIVYLEKRGPIEYYEHPYYTGFWVRVPYNPYTANFNFDTTNQHDSQDQAGVSFRWNAIREGYKITPGYYRFVVFVENKPHYINFEIE